MSERVPETEYEERDAPTSRAAVGLVATRTNGDAVAGAVLRARRHGHAAVVVGDPETEAATFARQLGATVVERDGAPPRRRLERAARERGFPGVLHQPDPTARVDFEASRAALAEAADYGVDAARAPVVDRDPAVLVAIPAYEEAGAIADVVETAREHADEVLVVDDGSADATAERARAAGATVVEHDRNRGYGGALKTAFAEAERANATHLVVLDGDGQHDAADVPELVRAQRESGASVVVGSRFEGDSETHLPAYRRLGLQVVNLLTNLSLGFVRARSRVSDTQSGFRAYDRRAIASLADDDAIGDNMGASTDILHHAHRHGYEIAEVGTTVDYDVENASSQNPVTHGLHLVSNILRTIEEERPVSVLGVPGFFSTLFGLGFGYLTFATYIDVGVFPLGLALVSAFFTLAGILACFTAIILHSLDQHVS